VPERACGEQRLIGVETSYTGRAYGNGLPVHAGRVIVRVLPLVLASQGAAEYASPSTTEKSFARDVAMSFEADRISESKGAVQLTSEADELRSPLSCHTLGRLSR
jgi:hypothetical protein